MKTSSEWCVSSLPWLTAWPTCPRLALSRHRKTIPHFVIGLVDNKFRGRKWCGPLWFIRRHRRRERCASSTLYDEPRSIGRKRDRLAERSKQVIRIAIGGKRKVCDESSFSLLVIAWDGFGIACYERTLVRKKMKRQG